MIGLAYWLIVDMLIQRTTGNHVLDYCSAAFNSDSWEWVGRDRVAAMQRRLLLILLLVGGLLSVGLLISRFIGQRIEHRLGTRFLGGCWFGITCFYVGAMLGVVPARQHLVVTVHAKSVVDCLELYLPDMPLFFPDRPGAECAAKLTAPVLADYDKIRNSLYQARPIDDRLVIPKENRPHIVIFVVESLRHHMISAQFMKRLHAWSATGLQFQRHYSGANCSHYGLFSMLYGRSPLVYDSTLDAQVPPQMCHSLRKAGYEAWFITGSECGNFFRMGEYLNERTFDHAIDYLQGDWPKRDLQSLNRVREVLAASHGRPQFVVVFLMSTHHDYEFPPAYARHKPYVASLDLLSGDLRSDRAQIMNRYWNAADFLDDQVADLVESLDPTKHLMVVTGDHGESIFDDGTLTHGSKLSEIQTRVPLVMVGANSGAKQVTQPTTHLDILPTILHILNGRAVPLAHAHGRSALEAAPNARLMLVQGFLDEHGSHDWDRVLFIDDPWRMLWSFQRSQSAVRFQGFLDKRAQLVFDQAPNDEQLSRLASGLMDKLREVAEQRKEP